MRSFVTILGKLVVKIFVLVALTIVAVVNFIAVILSLTFRYLMLPLMVVSLVIGGSTYFESGFDSTVLECAGIFLVAATTYFVLPYIPNILSAVQTVLFALLRAPLIYKSPVKYTF